MIFFWCFHPQVLRSCVSVHHWTFYCLFLHLYNNQETGQLISDSRRTFQSMAQFDIVSDSQNPSLNVYIDIHVYLYM